MPFLLVNAETFLRDETLPSTPENVRPAASNGTTINELGDGTVLSPKFSSSEPPRAGGEAPPDLPPFDVQYVPEGFRDVGSVEFTVNKPNGETTVTDNTAPFSLSQAVDGVFEMPEFLRGVEGEVKISVRVFSRDDLGGRELTLDRPEPSVTFTITQVKTTQTDFDTGPSRANTEAEAEVEVAAGNGQASAAVALAAAAGAAGARSLAGGVTSASLALSALDAQNRPITSPAPIRPGGVEVVTAPSGIQGRS